MGLVIKNNIASLKILNRMDYNNNALTKSMQRISSGMKINSAADDPAAYSIAMRMEIHISGLNRAVENAQRGASMLQTASGALDSTMDILKTLKEKAIEAANDTSTTADRRIIQDEINQLLDQINDNASVTFNERALLDGSLNQKVDAANANVFTNEALATQTAFSTELTALADRDGNSLDIKSSDTIKISFVRNGQTFTTSFQAGTANTLADIFKNANDAAGGEVFDEASMDAAGAGSFIGTDAFGVSQYAASGESVISVKAGAAGVTGAVAGFSISVSGTDGNVKKNINQRLDAFSESIRAFNPSGDHAVTLQIGSKSNQSIRVSLGDMRAQALGLQGVDPVTGVVKNIDVTTREHANAAIDVIDNAIQKTLEQQTSLGAAQNRLEYTIENLTTEIENLTSAMSVIRDANMAKEMTEFTKNNILMQAAQAMLAQSNHSAEGILTLLQ